MQVESSNDLRLIGRAIKEGWDIPRQRIIAALMEPIDNRDPDLMIPAADVLRKMDEVNVKREVIQKREDKENEDRRIQLFELAKRIPARELARLASVNGIVAESGQQGRADKSARANGQKTGRRTRPKNTKPLRTKPQA